MTDRVPSRTPTHLPDDELPGKSIFPIFDINVPMPKDTAMPGSYNRREQLASEPMISNVES